MNILMVSSSFPSPTSGSSTRAYHILKSLAHEHKVSLLLSLLVNDIAKESSHDVSALKEFVQSIQIISQPAIKHGRRKQLTSLLQGKSYTLNRYILPEVQEALDNLLADHQYDIVLFEGILVADYRIPKDVQIIIDLYDIQHELVQRSRQRKKNWLSRWYGSLEHWLIKPAELKLCKTATHILVCSERERFYLQGLLPESTITVVPNGVDIENFHAQQKQEVHNRIIFTGAMNYFPNVDAVLFFAYKCWPLILSKVPDATWQIVGRDPTAEVLKLAKLPHVTVTGSVPAMQPYLAASTVAIAPILAGSGTRLKILEALAMKKAVVSTTIGCEGLSIESGKHLIVADEAEAFARAVIAFLYNPELRAAYGDAGRSLVESIYSWEYCGQQLLQALKDMSSDKTFIQTDFLSTSTEGATKGISIPV